MHERFTRTVEALTADEVKAELTKDDANVAVLIEQLAADAGGQVPAEKILMLQRQKQLIVEELRAMLAEVDAGGTAGHEGQGRGVVWNEAASQLEVYGKGGTTQPITEGQLAVAAAWGEEYYLDASVPRAQKKRYLLSRARQQIADLYDQQIVAFEMHQSYNKNSELARVYGALNERFETGSLEDGEIAEKMVESFLTKLAIDNDLPFTIERVSVDLDVELKIDFIVHPKTDDDSLGVGVNEPDRDRGAEKRDVGVQFTTSKSERSLERKARQTVNANKRIALFGAPVEKLVLVTLPIEHVRDTYEAWKGTKPGKRTPGGPDELWPEGVKKQVFFGILEKTLTPEAVERAWEKVSG